jgi:hypothetical protein
VRYFTRGLVNGELGDNKEAQAKAAYAQRLEAISPRLPASVLKLAGLNLHDASIENVLWEPAVKRLRLSLLTLAPPSRYQAVALTYSGALLGEQRICAIRDVARDRPDSRPFPAACTADGGGGRNPAR